MSRQLLAKVHIAKKELGLDNVVYRAVLRRLTGQETSKGLTVQELDSVIAEFKRMGWVPKTKDGRAVKPSTDPRVRMIWAIWNELCRRKETHTPTPAGLRAFIKNRTGVEQPDWLNNEQLNQVIKELRSWQKRAQKRGDK